jgi:UDP-N-acetylmuramate-alanine ligase
MIVKVTNLYSEHTDTFKGEPEQIRSEIRARFDWLQRYGCATLQQELEKLGQAQAYHVAVEQE